MTSSAFCEIIVSLSLQVTVLICATALLTHWTRDGRIGDRLWTTCHLGILALATVAIALPHLRILPHSSLFHHRNLAHAVASLRTTSHVCIGFYVVGATITFLCEAAGFIQSIRILRSSQPIAADQLLSAGVRFTGEAQDQSESSAQGMAIQLRVSSELGTPACWQIHRPIILLPRFLGSFAPEEISAAIRHERAHLAAAHPLRLFLQRIVEVLFWFHPLVWWAASEAEKYREFRCDAAACQSRDDAVVYLRSLLRLAFCRTLTPRTNSLHLAFAGRQSVMQQRVKRIVDRFQADPLPSRGPWGKHLVQAMAIVMATILWVPVDVHGSNREFWSPWPGWTAHTLKSLGVSVRDYEIDAHRMAGHAHASSTKEPLSAAKAGSETP